MTNIKNVVKVMNFHSLLRVDKAKKKADKFRELETEIEEFMSIILNNQNLKCQINWQDYQYLYG